MNKRKHVQIALVGGQPTPVYQGVVHLEPDLVILICSESSKAQATRIKEQLPNYTDRDLFIRCISDNDIDEMYAAAAEIESWVPKGMTLSLNLSSGLKAWTVVFHRVFRRKRRSCKFFCIAQGGMFFDLKNNKTLQRVSFDMEVQFKLLGHEVSGSKSLAEYTSDDFEVLKIVKKLALSQNTHDYFKNLTSLFVESYKENYGNSLYSEPYGYQDYDNILEWDPDRSEFKCMLYGQRDLILSSPHVLSIVLNTGWFELYVATMIAYKYPKSSITLNCVFKSKRDIDKNEVDIIVNTGNKLIFVECKTQVYNSTDVDKFNSVVKGYGGLGSKALFVTNSRMKEEAKEKCDGYGISTFFFYNPKYKNNEDKIDALSQLLDKLDREWNV